MPGARRPLGGRHAARARAAAQGPVGEIEPAAAPLSPPFARAMDTLRCELLCNQASFLATLSSTLELARGGPPSAAPLPSHPGCSRLIGELSDSTRRGTAALLGRALVTYSLAQVQARQADDDRHECPHRLDNSLADKHWQTFSNLISDSPDKDVTQPVTVATDVKVGLAAMLLGVADLISVSGPVPPEAYSPLEWLAARPRREAAILRLMIDSTSQLSHLLRADPLSYDLDFPEAIRLRLEALLRVSLPRAPKQKTPFVALHHAVAVLVLNWVRALGWFAGNRVYESEHLCCNRDVFMELVAGFAAVVPPASAGSAGVVGRFLRDQLDSWDRALAKGKLLAKKPAPAPRSRPAPSAGAAARPASSLAVAKVADGGAPGPHEPQAPRSEGASASSQVAPRDGLPDPGSGAELPGLDSDAPHPDSE